MVHVGIFGDCVGVLYIHSKFAKEVLRKFITRCELENARIKHDFVADIKILYSVECVIVWWWSYNAVPSDQSA